MRRIVEFSCERARLLGTLDEAAGETGLLIVSGGNEIRVGAHRGMAKLAAAVAAAGHPVLRFDRRGVGDSEGDNRGFRASGPDIAAAIAAFRAEANVGRMVAFGNCDAATALAMHASVDALILSNPWVIEPSGDLPPPAAIRDRYARRIRDPAAWAALLTGKVDLRAVAKGLGRIALPQEEDATLIDAFARGLARHEGPVTIVLAERDNTAIAFTDAWKSGAFDAVRKRVELVRIETASHSYSGDGDYDALLGIILGQLGRD